MSKIRRVAGVLVGVIAVVGLLVFGLASLGLQSALPWVDPRPRHRVSGSGLDRQWAWCVVVTSVTIIAAAGLPIGKAWAGRGSAAGAVLQGIGGVVVAGWTAAVTRVMGIYLFVPEDYCLYPSCWPNNHQMVASLVPGVLTGLVMITMAMLVTRLRWWIRALVPVVVWVAALLIQYAVWTSYLLPIFEGPPR
ncbi:hypothetical protein [Goodfellowiella coeruleoviolacea]|uniref:hypothetical protein n=1 Tax=Goodfellowiella coeruleoviolacea TaxID=334858 RepID=UPI0020A27F3D|nr:hypothetical protein [Goodfellowiella coeruleoviolacea]